MKVKMKFLRKLIREICRELKIQPFITLCTCGSGDEVIIKDTMPRLVITKPIKPGFKRKIKLTSDEPLDLKSEGVYFEVAKVSGDADLPVADGAQSPGAANFWLLGSTGASIGTPQVFSFSGDGHVGDGEAVIAVEVEYTVNHPDATEITAVVTEIEQDEPI